MKHSSECAAWAALSGALWLAGCSGTENPGTPAASLGGASTAAGSPAVYAGTGGSNASAGSPSSASGGGASGGETTLGGSSGSSGSGGLSGSGGALDTAGSSSLPKPSSEGDGDRTIGPTYTASPLVQAKPGSAKGKLLSFDMHGAESTIYPGVNGDYTRGVKVYVPAAYVPGSAAPFIVAQDAMAQDVLPPTVENLIAMKSLPKLVLIFVNNGGGDAQGSQRGLEYDTVSGLFAEFIEREVLPRVVSEAKKQLNLELKLTTDPEGRGTFGGSSGGAASFSMAWWHPDLFRRVLSYSGTFVSQISEPTPIPHGCWAYHDVDPHFSMLSEAPKGLIVQRCESPSSALGIGNPGPCDTPLTPASCEAVGGCRWNTEQNRPVRAWLESGDADLGTDGHELDPKYGSKPYRDFDIANQRMAAALKSRGYQYHYDHALKAGHVDGNVLRQTLPEALMWVWRGYPLE